MIHVLVAEDEQPILRSTCMLIERLNPSFRVVKKAVNGKEVLEVLEKEKIDFIVLDIQMPVMNGLEVLKQMEKNKYQIPTVILSGFQDFSYVREAMRFGVIDYLLKPIKREELLSVLNNVEDLVWRKRSSEKSEMAIEQQVQEYEIALCTLGSYYLLPEEYELTQEQEDFGRNISKILKNKIKEESRWIIPGRYPNEQLIIFRKLGNRTEEIIKFLYEQLLNEKMPVTIILNREIQNHKSIYDSNRQMRKKMKATMELEQSTLCLDGLNNEWADNKEEIEKARQVIKDIQFPNQIESGMEKVLKNITRRCVITEVLKESFLRFCSSMECQYPYMEIEDEICRIVQNTYSKEQLQKEIKKMIFYSFIQNNQKTGKKKVAMEVKEYLDQNYYEQIGNQTLSSMFGFVPTHLRCVFKESYGISPMEYLQNVRIEKSAKMLISEPNMPIKDIAEAVGFMDALYYSKVFRKKMGTSPSRYRGVQEEE